MNPKLIKPLKNHLGYFIHVSGFVFKTYQGKDIILEATHDIKSNSVFIEINGVRMNLLYLMVENFMPKIGQHQQFKYTVQNKSRIPLNSIKVTDFTSTVNDLHIEVIHKFNCKQRADNANLRASAKITPVHIAEVLILHDFKCVYCSEELNQMSWHLDHIIPLSKSGANKFENIAPSCAVCNIMKSNTHPTSFYNKCLKIAANYKFKDS